MSQRTLEIIYVAVAVTVCAAILGMLALLGVAALKFGDGEGAKILSDLTPPLIGAFGALVAMVAGPHVAGVISAAKQPPIVPLPPVKSITAGNVTTLDAGTSPATTPTVDATPPGSVQ